MLIQAEDKTIVNMQCIREIWIYKQRFKDNEMKYYVECNMTEGMPKTVKTCNTRAEAEKTLEQILSQYDRGQRVIKIK